MAQISAQNLISRPVAALLLAVCLLSGCSASAPPASDESRALKGQILTITGQAATQLAEPAAAHRARMVADRLARFLGSSPGFSPGIPFGIAVLDRNGITLAERSMIHHFAAQNYSNYQAVARALKDRKPVQGKLFLQDGSRLLMVCVPLYHRDRLAGAMVLGLSADDVHDRLGVSEREFMAIDFNR